MRRSDEWETPQWLFDQLNDEFHFDIDLCATLENKKTEDWVPDVFADFYMGNQTGFMNPPYSNPLPFVRRAKDLVFWGATVVMLLKVDTSTKWWSNFWDYDNHQPKEGVEIRLLPKKLKYELKGVPGQAAPFPSCIVIMRP